MHFCFIDESGTPPKPTAQNPRPFFVIASVIVPVTEWHGIADELEALKNQPEYAIKGEIKWRHFAPNNTASDNSIRHLAQDKRDKFRIEMYKILSIRRSIRVLACVTSVKDAYALEDVNDESDLYHCTYKPVFENFFEYLSNLSEITGSNQYGIFVSDHRESGQDKRLREHHELLTRQQYAFQASGNLFNEDSDKAPEQVAEQDKTQQNTSKYMSYRNNNLIENLFLAPSHQSVGVQFADMVAGAIARKFNSNEETQYLYVKPCLRRGFESRIENSGIVTFPEKDQ